MYCSLLRSVLEYASVVLYRLTKTGSEETGKEAKINKYLNYIIYNTTILQYCQMVGKEFAWKAVLHPALTADVRS